MSKLPNATPPTQPPVIRAIVVDDGNTTHTRAILAGLAKQTLPVNAIAVMATQPEALALTAEEQAQWRVQVVATHPQQGYAQKVNIAARQWGTQADALWLLDGVPKPAALQYLWQTVQAAPAPHAVLVSAAVQLHSATVTRAYRFNMAIGKLVPLGTTDMTPERTDVLSRHGLLIPQHAWATLGLLDERLFKYWEAVDYCVRAKRAGFALMYQPQALVRIDKPITASNATDSFYLVRNRWWILGPHLGLWQKCTFMLWDGWVWLGLLAKWLFNYTTPQAKGHYELARLYWWGVYQGVHPFPPQIE